MALYVITSNMQASILTKGSTFSPLYPDFPWENKKAKQVVTMYNPKVGT